MSQLRRKTATAKKNLSLAFLLHGRKGTVSSRMMRLVGAREFRDQSFARFFVNQKGKSCVLPRTMTAKLLTIIGFSFTLFLAGCATAERNPNTTQGAAAGAAIGAGLGAIIGNNTGSGSAGDGALVGAALGSVIGAIAGQQEDRAEQERREEAARQREEAALQRQREQELAIIRGSNATDREVFEAEQRAAEAEARLRQIEEERAAALARQRQLEDAARREAEANRRIAELEGVSTGAVGG